MDQESTPAWVKTVAEIICAKAAEGIDYIYSDFDPSSPFAPSAKKVNESWKVNFKRKSL